MFDVSIKDFSKAAAICAVAIERRNTIPVLGTMRAVANGHLVLDGGNLDMTATVAIPCETKTDTAILIDDPRALVSAIGAAGGASVTFEATESGYTAKAGQLQRTAKLHSKVADWPDHRCAVDEEAFTATLGSNFIAQLERVARAVSSEETRYNLNGVYVQHVAGWTYRLVATDGHRLMQADVELPDAAGELQAQIIPRHFVNAVLKHFRKVEGPIRFRVGTGGLSNAPDVTLDKPKPMQTRVALQAMVGNADVTFSGKVIDGKFPDYTRVVPASTKYQAIFKVAELRRAVQALSAGFGHMPAISFAFGANGCNLGVCHADEVTASYCIDVQHNATGGLIVGFNGHYLLDMLASLGGDDVSMGVDDSAAPSLWKSISDTSFTGVLMPMRV